MAGTVTNTEITTGSIKQLSFVWVSDASGNADGVSVKTYDGKLIGLTTIPAGGGSAPTDNYDVVITNASGFNVLLGAGADRDTANTEYVASASLGATYPSVLTLAVTNAGNAKGGTVVLYIQ